LREREALVGVIAPILTPFGDDLAVARDLYVAHARRVLAEGCVALAPFGTTGEATSLGLDERIALLDALVDAGLDPARLLPGTGLPNLPDTARLTRHAVDLGCAGALVLPPFFYKGVPEDGLFAHYARLVEAVGSEALRLYLYHIPQVAGVGLPVALVERLHRAFPGQIVGIKDSSGDFANTRALLAIDGLVVYPGSEATLPEALRLGAAGCISASANLNAARIAEVIRLAREGRWEEAERAQEAVRRVRRLIEEAGTIAAQKRLLALASGDPGWANVRPPLVAFEEERGRALAAALGEAGLRIMAPQGTG